MLFQEYYTLDEIDTAERSISDARYNADDTKDSARYLKSDIEDLLIEYVKEEEEPTTANKGDNNA